MDISVINYRIRTDPASFIKEAERAYYGQLEEIAGKLWEPSARRPIVLICGPSGSGKTTTALALERISAAWGRPAHTISMDNYFKPLTPEELELASRGEMDLESPLRLDIPLLNAQLGDMAEGRPVLIPKYDFKNSKRLPGERRIERKADELVILEGIHSLNPDVIPIAGELFYSVYVSVKTRITDDSFVLHPERIRLIRRLIRDSSHRGRSFKETLKMYESVQRGENLYIAPFKTRVDYEIDSAIAYELGAYKRHILGLLDDFGGIEDIKAIMDAAEEVDESLIPKDSLIREFIGGGAYRY